MHEAYQVLTTLIRKREVRRQEKEELQQLAEMRNVEKQEREMEEEKIVQGDK